jgi:hypothetical protein
MTRISIDGYEPAHLSFSTVSGFRSCGKRFELQKILRLEEKPGLAAIGGNAVHQATEQYDLGLWVPTEGGGVSPSKEVDNVRAQEDTGTTTEQGSKA